MEEDPLSLNRIRARKLKKTLKLNKINSLVILIIFSGCFFSARISGQKNVQAEEKEELKNYSCLLSPQKKWADDFYHPFSWLPTNANAPQMIAPEKQEKKNDFVFAEVSLLENSSIDDSRVEKKEKKTLENFWLEKNPLALKVREKTDINTRFDKKLEKEIYILTSNYPLREMSRMIAAYDRQVAGLIVGIAKKESDWGKHSPSLGGKTCYNYWGYKGTGSMGSAQGYSCFSSPEEAVKIVGDRIKRLSSENKLDSPTKMIVWKCGSSCVGHSEQSVRKWISDVDVYYRRIVNEQS